MIGSPVVGAWVAQIVFLALLITAVAAGRLRLTVIFAILWFAGYFGLVYLHDASGMFTPYVAVLAIALVFIVFNGDVPLN